MSRLSPYLRSLEKFGAQALVLQSNQSVVLRFPAGDRQASQQTPHATLVQLLQEVAPPAAMAQLEKGQPARFELEDGGRYQVELQVEAGGLLVTIHPAGFKAPAPPVEPAAVEVGEYEDLPIERTSYAAAEEIGQSGLVDDLLRAAARAGASDLHLSAGAPPMLRLAGELAPAPGRGALDGELLLRELMRIAPSASRVALEERHEARFCYAPAGGATRFRATLTLDRHGPCAAFRAIPGELPDARRLGVPEAALQLGARPAGLVVVAAPAGGGASTTLAALLEHVVSHRAAHVVTVEDPVEFLHASRRALIQQRELGSHVGSVGDAVRAALRTDADVVVLGELGSADALDGALALAEAGRLVLGAVRARSAAAALDGLVDLAAPERQARVAARLGAALAGVVSQALCRRVGGGRVAAFEVVLGTPTVAGLVAERRLGGLAAAVQAARGQGMASLTDALVEHVKARTVEARDAWLAAPDRAALRAALVAEGLEAP